MGLNQLINNFNENYKILDLDKLENQFKNNKVFTIINAYNYGKISIKKNKIIKRKQKILDLLLKKKNKILKTSKYFIFLHIIYKLHLGLNFIFIKILKNIIRFNSLLKLIY